MSRLLVPQFESLAAFRLDGSETDKIRDALRYLFGRSEAVGIAGFSFGAGAALLAAADFPEFALVASFGGYADLRNVVAYITTGVHTFDGRRYAERQEDYSLFNALSPRARQALASLSLLAVVPRPAGTIADRSWCGRRLDPVHREPATC